MLIERGNLQDATLDHIKQFVGNIRIEILASETQIYNANKVEKCLMEGCYFKNKSDELILPECLESILSKSEKF